MAMVRALESRELPRPRQAPGGFAVPSFRKVQVGGSDVLVTRLANGEAVAFATHCPHQGTPLDRAVLVADQVRCSQHNFVYDPTTGHNVRPALEARSEALFRLKPGYLPTFKVEEKDGWVWVSDTANPPPSGPPPRPMPPPSRHIPRAVPSEPEPSEDPVDLKTIMLGGVLDLELSTKGEPGHIWRVESPSGIVSLAGQTYDAGKDAYLVRLQADKPGAERVKLIFDKPWGGDIREARIYDITVRADS